jgi:hypothetical protein
MTFFRTPFDIIKQELQVDAGNTSQFFPILTFLPAGAQGSKLARVIGLIKDQRGTTGTLLKRFSCAHHFRFFQRLYCHSLS